MNQHIGYGKQIWQRFFLNAEDTFVGEMFTLSGGVYAFAFKVIQSRSKKAASTASKICNRFIESRSKTFNDKISNSTGRIKFTGITSTLQTLQNSFVNAAKKIFFFGSVTFNRVNFVDDLPKDSAVFHVLVDVCENFFNDGLFHRS